MMLPNLTQAEAVAAVYNAMGHSPEENNIDNMTGNWGGWLIRMVNAHGFDAATWMIEHPDSDILFGERGNLSVWVAHRTRDKIEDADAN